MRSASRRESGLARSTSLGPVGTAPPPGVEAISFPRAWIVSIGRNQSEKGDAAMDERKRLRSDPVGAAHLRTLYEWLRESAGTGFPAWHDPDAEVELHGTVPASWLLSQLDGLREMKATDEACEAVGLEPGRTVGEIVAKIRDYWAGLEPSSDPDLADHES